MLSHGRLISKRFPISRPSICRFPICGGRLILALALLLAAPLSPAPARAQIVATPIPIDASQPWHEPDPAPYDGGSATSPSGVTLGLNNRYLTLDGKPWLPVSGEFHFSRYPRDQWEDEILKMKAAGANVISTYVIWIHHEEIQGQFDWTGQRDLRAFAQLCARHHMYLIARIGPWDHAEVRNGGLPDWVLKQGPTRENDPTYLASVRTWYGQIGEQLKGLLWKDGGPVIAIQLENEYSKRGPRAGDVHILELKKIALASGLDVPLYLVTGWDNAVVPPRAVIPVYGGYPDAPWDNSITKLPPAEVYAFRFQSRIAGGANDARSRDEPGVLPSASDSLPYLTAEIGGGIEDTYHRRPVIAPDDIAAMVPVMLGSGVNLYGTYMFQGGENPDGQLTTLQESQATGYPNDLPIKSYDFQAPLSEFGQERDSLRKLKVFNYFLNDFGAELAPMTVHAPDSQPRNPGDLSVPRASVRSRGDAGFIFFNNYVRGAAMPVRRAAQFQIRLPGPQGNSEIRGKPSPTLAVPRHPIDLPSGAYFIWPFNLRLAGITLRYSTAQLFTRIENSGIETVYFEAIPGIAAEFAFDAATVRSVKVSSGKTITNSGVLYVTGIEPDPDSAIDVVSSAGAALRFVVLTAGEAKYAWKVHIAGSDHLLITTQDFLADPDSRPARIWLCSIAKPHFQFFITPPTSAPLQANVPLTPFAVADRIPVVDAFTAEVPQWNAALQFTQIRAAGEVPPIKLGPAQGWRPHGVAQAPDAGVLPQAAQWSIAVPAGALDHLSELFLEVAYEGDVARLSSDRRLLDDDFYNGKPWMIGLSRFLAPDGSGKFELSILPLRKDAPVYFEFPQPLQFGPDGQIDKLDSIRLIPVYQVEITAPTQ
jgi:beta-galactosidase